MKFNLTLFVLFLCLTFSAFSQNDYEEWVKKQNQELDSFISKMDKEFYEYLKKDWVKGEVKEGIKKEKSPKPKTIPSVNSKEIDKDITKKTEDKTTPVIKNKNEDSPVQKEATPKVVLNSESKKKQPEPDKNKEVKKEDSYLNRTSNEEKVSDKQLGKSNSKKELDNSETNAETDASLTYETKLYGEKIKFLSNKKVIFPKFSGSIDNESIAEYYKSFVSLHLQPLLTSLTAERKRLAVNDFALIKLVWQASSAIFNNDINSRYLFTWIIMMKMGYDVHLAYKENGLFITINSSDILYGTPVFSYPGSDAKYYLAALTDKDKTFTGQSYSYEGNFPEANHSFKMAIKSSPNFSGNGIIKERNLVVSGKVYSVRCPISKDLMQYYDDLPQFDNDLYFITPFNNAIESNIKAVFNPLLANKSFSEKIDILLSFAQSATGYKTDGEQFGREKSFYPDETLYYDFSDCEDRSVLFSWLVRLFTNAKVIGLSYPGHISTAVEFPSSFSGDRIEYKGISYLICDATFLGGNIGQCMPQFKNTKPEIIEINQ